MPAHRNAFVSPEMCTTSWYCGFKWCFPNTWPVFGMVLRALGLIWSVHQKDMSSSWSRLSIFSWRFLQLPLIWEYRAPEFWKPLSQFSPSFLQLCKLIVAILVYETVDVKGIFSSSTSTGCKPESCLYVVCNTSKWHEVKRLQQVFCLIKWCGKLVRANGVILQPQLSYKFILHCITFIK